MVSSSNIWIKRIVQWASVAYNNLPYILINFIRRLQKSNTIYKG